MIYNIVLDPHALSSNTSPPLHPLTLYQSLYLLYTIEPVEWGIGIEPVEWGTGIEPVEWGTAWWSGGLHGIEPVEWGTAWWSGGLHGIEPWSGGLVNGASGVGDW